MRHGSLFSGIGGFDLAAQWVGWENIFHCEWNEFGQRVLKYYWPKATSYHDITKTDFTIHRGGIDILTGGFPCQPYSSAGKRLGKEDERHLWPEMLRAIREIQPRWVVGENVLGLVNWNGGLVFDEVQADLEAEGYEVQPFILPAASTNAPHKRDRVWFVAYSDKCNDGRITREDESESGEERVQERDAIRQSVESGKVRRDATNSDNRLGNKQKGQVQAGGNAFECSGQWDASNSKCDGLEHSSKSGSIGESKGEARQRVTGHASTESQDGHSTNSNMQRGKWIGQQGEPGEKGKRREELFSELDNSQYRWQIFPTQSPICGGDDGLPTKLDGITFPKWRNESIKAYGNAVVPQVVYEIFKAIEQYEELHLRQAQG